MLPLATYLRPLLKTELFCYMKKVKIHMGYKLIWIQDMKNVSGWEFLVSLQSKQTWILFWAGLKLPEGALPGSQPLLGLDRHIKEPATTGQGDQAGSRMEGPTPQQCVCDLCVHSHCVQIAGSTEAHADLQHPPLPRRVCKGEPTH